MEACNQILRGTIKGYVDLWRSRAKSAKNAKKSDYMAWELMCSFTNLFTLILNHCEDKLA
jgi:hypothetical protein